MDLADLIGGLERATEGSRELDCLIWAEINGRDTRWDGNLLLARNRKPPHDECRLGCIDPGVTARNFSLAWSQPETPHYTSSVDSALTLVPAGWTTTIVFPDASHNLASQATLHRGEAPYFDSEEIDVTAETAALALCIAALKARQSEKDSIFSAPRPTGRLIEEGE